MGLSLRDAYKESDALPPYGICSPMMRVYIGRIKIVKPKKYPQRYAPGGVKGGMDMGHRARSALEGAS